jgi:hypothetical protein
MPPPPWGTPLTGLRVSGTDLTNWASYLLGWYVNDMDKPLSDVISSEEEFGDLMKAEERRLGDTWRGPAP